MAKVKYIDSMNGKKFCTERAEYTKDGQNIDSALNSITNNIYTVTGGNKVSVTETSDGITISANISPGPQGPSGPVGYKGFNGPSGYRGVSGAQGPCGPVGAKGPCGPSGVKGPCGPQGNTGVTGAQGPCGPIGNKGPCGPSGNPGTATGPKGNTGVTGAKGPCGPSGNKGPCGPSGDRGLVGEKGATGTTGTGIWPNLKVGTYSKTLTPSSSWQTLDSWSKSADGGIAANYITTTTSTAFYVDIKIENTTKSTNDVKSFTISKNTPISDIWFLNQNCDYTISIMLTGGTAASITLNQRYIMLR